MLIRELVVGVAATGLLLTGCSADESPTSSPAAIASTGSDSGRGSADVEVTEEPLLKTPLQAYRLTPTELVTVDYAEDLLVQQCMDRFGFDHAPRRSFSDELQAMLKQERWDISRLYGVSNREWAEEYGYGLPADDPESTVQEPERSASFDFVLGGQRPSANGDLAAPSTGKETESPGEVDGQPIPPGGCVGEARRELGTGDPNVSVFGLAHDLRMSGRPEFEGGDAYREAVGEWIACLADKGYRVTAPLADQGDIGKVLDARAERGDDDLTGPATPSEIELAVADVDCKQQVRFVKRLDEARAALDAKTIEENQLALEEDRKRLDAQVRKATRVVEEAS